MKIFNMIIICLVLFSCQTIFVGEFSSSKSPYRLSIHKDSTFEYEYHEGVLYKYSFGHWRQINRNKIELISTYLNRSLELSGEETSETGDRKIAHININTNIPQNKQRYYRCLLFLNSKYFTEIACDSLSNIQVKLPLTDIMLKITADKRIPTRDADTLITDHYLTKNKELSDLLLTVGYNDTLFNYQVFNHMVLNFGSKNMRFNDYKLHLH